MSKPSVQIADAFVFGDRLCGKPLDYPEEHQHRAGAVTNGRTVITSKIIKVDGDTVETQRTIYNVVNWIVNA